MADQEHPATYPGRAALGEALAFELALGTRRPVQALGHTLALHRPASFLPCTGIGQLTKQFDAVAREHPEVASARQAVEEVNWLRTMWITRAVPELSDFDFLHRGSGSPVAMA